MGDIYELVEEARTEVAAVAREATRALAAGVPIARVHAAVTAAAEHLEDIEALALLAGSGDEAAEAAIRRHLGVVQSLTAALADHDC